MLYQCVFPCGTIPQSHAVIRSGGEEEEAVGSEAESVHSAIVSRVHWLKTKKRGQKLSSALVEMPLNRFNCKLVLTLASTQEDI